MTGFLAALVAGVAMQATPAPAAPPLRVLFVGNSYTYFNNAPAVFAALARTAAPNRAIHTQMVALPGETLLALWERSPARDALRASRWDYVVLQDQSRLGDGLRDGRYTVNAPRLLHWGVRLFDAEVRRTGARTVVMQTWSRRDQPEDQAALDHAYDSVARELEALLAPVGRAWQRARQEQPTIELYASDGSHPAAAGSYLLACTLLFTLLPEAGAELPPSVTGPAVSTAGVVDAGSDTVLVTLPPEHARRLQAIARAVVGDLKRQGGYLHASPPARAAAAPRGGPPLNAERLAGAWSGDLTYFPSPARFDLTLRVEGGKCEGDVAIQFPQRRQRYEAPLGTCQIAADRITFTVGTLPLPFLFDRFEGRLVDERLVGTVERTGRELTNAMSGVWTLGRGAEAAPSGAR